MVMVSTVFRLVVEDGAVSDVVGVRDDDGFTDGEVIEFVGINGQVLAAESERAPEGMEMVEPLPSTAEADWLETESESELSASEAVPRRSME